MLSLPGAPGCYCFLCPRLILSRSQFISFKELKGFYLELYFDLGGKNCFCHFSGNRLGLSAALLGNLGYYLIAKCQFCNEILAAGMQQIDLLDIYRNPIMYMRSMHLHCVTSVINRHLQFLWTVLIAIKCHRALCTVRQKYSTYTPCNWSFIMLVVFFFHKWEKR